MRYSAFISYSHADARWAKWLHRSLERYRLPKRLRTTDGSLVNAAGKFLPVFRDNEELAASSDLGGAIVEALENSAALIVICSPRAARSRWVNEEVKTYVGLGRGDRIFCVIVDGAPHSGDPETESFPPALLAMEPLAVDLRGGRAARETARLKLIAGVLGLRYDELRQREAARRNRRLAVAASLSLAGLILMTGLAITAFLARNEAVRQRDLARQRTLTAERTVDFVRGLFLVTDPSEARGRSITAREVLDRGVQRLRDELQNEPAVRADLAATLAEVYGALGLFRESDRLIRWSLTIGHGEPELRVRQWTLFSESQLRLGQAERSAQGARYAVTLARQIEDVRPELLLGALVALGEAELEVGDLAAARNALEEAYPVAVAHSGQTSSGAAQILEDLYQVELFSNNLEGARRHMERALEMRRRLEGDMSPSVSDDMIALARIAGAQGDNATAARVLRSRLAIDERVLGPNHPAVADLLNDLGRALFEQRDYAGAQPLLERAAAINLRERGALSEQIAAVYFNLGVVYHALGDRRAAETFESALRASEGNATIRGLVMAEFADVQCQSSRVAEGTRQAQAALPIISEAFADAPWRSAWANMVLGTCLVRSGDAARGRALIRAAIPAMREKWRPGTHYRQQAERRLSL
jgi:tetratricopeptide (TPR) repeat protein